MISRGGNKNFLVAHYDWLAAGFGVLALAAGVVLFLGTMGEDPDEAAAAEVAAVASVKTGATGVKPVEMTGFEAVARALRTPPTASEISEKAESFLASERRVLCKKCSKAIVGDIKACPECPFCGEKQEVAVKVVLDADGDGLPDEWEKKYGLNVNDPADASADKDKDGFTNLEEFQAKTDPTDPKDHPDYLDSLAIQLPLKETKMPFVFKKASQVPGGWRCEFLDPARKDDYGRNGRTVSVKTGEKIIDATIKEKFDYGFTLKSYTAKSVKRERKGMKGMMVDVDASEAVVERNSDGRQITLVVQTGKGAKLAPVDVQAVLVFNRGQPKRFEVTSGAEIQLFDTKYRIVDIKAVEKGAKVTVETVLGGKKRVLEALEQ